LFSLIIFDLDGTLVDSRKDIADAVNFTLKTLGLPTLQEETIYGYVGNGVSRLIADATAGQDAAVHERAVKTFEDYYLAHLTDHTCLYPGMDKVLERYGKKRKVLVTNKRGKFTRKIMENLGVADRFERLISADETGGHLKPDPDMIWKALAELNIPAKETVVIGDMTNDIKAARVAGVAICAVGYGFGSPQGLKEAKPDFYVDTVSDLMTLPFT
jgi:phosphoglycolate phosphatase